MTVALMGAWLALGTLASAPGYADNAADTAVRQSLERLAEAWNTSKAEAWATEYWPEGELINIRGDVLSGPSQVRDQTAKILAGPFRGSNFTYVRAQSSLYQQRCCYRGYGYPRNGLSGIASRNCSDQPRRIAD
jgi:hypothetical protein